MSSHKPVVCTGYMQSSAPSFSHTEASHRISRILLNSGHRHRHRTELAAGPADLITMEWEPLPSLSAPLLDPGVAAVAGGLIAVGDHQEDRTADGEQSEWDMLFDEAHARWYTLPHKLPQKRMAVRMVAWSAAMVASA
eukprot:COSAG01_NODE_622_length_14779_cov_69.589305_6_plen_138_part_00